MLDAFANGLISKDHKVSGPQLTKTASSSRWESTTIKQIVSTRIIPECIAMQLFYLDGRATESNQDTKLISAAQTVVNKAFSMTFQIAALQTSVAKILYTYKAVPNKVDAVVACMLDAFACTISVAKIC